MTDREKISELHSWPRLYAKWFALSRLEKQYVLDAMDADSSRAWIALAIKDAKIEMEEQCEKLQITA